MIAPLWNGKDVTESWRGCYVIDTHGWDESDLAKQAPKIWQHLKNTVYPERQSNRDPKLQRLWWLFRRSNTDVRDAMAGLPRTIVTSETAKHRFFVFLEAPSKPEHKLVVISHSDGFILGVLSSSLHVTWSRTTGSWLGVGNDSVYVKSRCFEPFPFPALEESPLKQRIRDLGERLDSHRKRQQQQHPGLTLTGMYNVLEKLRSGEPLTAKEKQIHDQGLVTVLRQIHDELDAAVLEAYGWGDLNKERGTGILPVSSSETHRQDACAPFSEALLTRLVALNHERAAEEKRGLIRYLRPDYQNPTKASDGHRPPLQGTLAGTDPDSSQSKIKNQKSSIINPSSSIAWPDRLPDQVAILRKLIASYDKSVVTPEAETLSALFGRKNKKRTEQIEGILETLKGLGQL